MELAGRGAAVAMERCLGSPAGKHVALYCGKGNNGGDGFVLARCLHERGALVQVLVPNVIRTDDAQRNLDLLKKMARHSSRILFGAYEDDLSADWYVDALLGTGVTQTLRPEMLDLVRRLNAAPGVLIALDMPTGLHPDTGVLLGDAVRASLTVTMAALKPGLLVGDGPGVAGRVVVIDIGIPRYILEEAQATSEHTGLSTDDAVRRLLPTRPRRAHKYSVGMALVIGGSPGLTGAPVMASTAAARIGAGYVTCAIPASVQALASSRLTEIATVALPETRSGDLDATAAMDVLSEPLERANAILIGPGLGRSASAESLVRQLLTTVDLPTVIDADGLRALAGMRDLVTGHSNRRWVLTPHLGEFRHLTSTNPADPLEAARHCAKKWMSIVALKGMPTVVATPQADAYICSTGNTALATAGTGDVLAGMCTSLLAQGMHPIDAMVCAAHIGGSAADRYASNSAAQSMMALDMVRELPGLLADRYIGHETMKTAQ